MNTLAINRQSILFPSKWDELSPNQYLLVAKEWIALRKAALSGESIHNIRIRLLFALLSPDRSVFSKRARTINKLNEYHIHDILPSSDFLIKSIDITKQLLPSVRIGLRRFHGPSESLSNITLREFAYADTLFASYMSSKNQNILDQLAAVLYRPARNLPETGDVREEFNPNIILERAKLFKSLDPKKKEAILLFYQGCRNSFERKYPSVFNNDNTPLAGKSGGWANVILRLAGGKFGDIEKTALTNLNTILLFLEMTLTEKK